MRRRQKRDFARPLRKEASPQRVVSADEVRIWNDTSSPIYVQGYGAKDVVRLWPACRHEVAPGEKWTVPVRAGVLGKETLQLAIRLRYCAKLLRVRRGSVVRISVPGRGKAVSIEGRPRDTVLKTRDISHWSRVGLPEAQGTDLADVDGIFGDRSTRDRLQSWAALSLYLGTDKGNAEVAVPLEVVEATHDRLPARVLPAHPAARASSRSSGVPPGAVVVGTVRCGYGHHRIALALASFGAENRPALLHDFASVEESAPPVALLTRLDAMYSKLSRIASEDRTGVIGGAWNELLASGDANASRSMRSFCERLKPMLLGLHPDTPIVAAHTFVAVTALLCGFRNVTNLVFDNHAQPVHVVPPPATNCVQTPKCEQQLLAMGVPASHVRLVGHFVPKDLADNVIADVEARRKRARKSAPRRFLLSVGGAGAQERFLTGVVRGLVRLSRELPDGLCVFVNVGDHSHMHREVCTVLRREGVRFSEHSGLTAATDFAAERAEESAQDVCGNSAFAVFSGAEPMEATAVTDVLTRVADVLVTKPSELAFYPLPKLHIRRVGDHEAQAAVRAHELGDGTPEAPTVATALQYARDLAAQDELFLRMCDSVTRQAEAGGYHGAQRALELAFEKATFGRSKQPE